ncbi:LysR substrate-binding domain-containing protein [Trinickia terrae]|nr:LysR substrate-binding domain-containing protein [Trinickia terrae]
MKPITAAIAGSALIKGIPLATWQHPLNWVGGLAAEVGRDDPVLPIVAFGGTCPWQEKLFAALRLAGIPWRVVCTSTSLSAIQAAVEAELGIAVLPEWTIRRATMRTLDPHASGLPQPPLADFGLFSLGGANDVTSAVQTLQRFLFHALRLGSADEPASGDVPAVQSERTHEAAAPLPPVAIGR